MKVDYIALSIPVFFILIGIELLYSFITHKHYYRLNDAITNISLGVGQQVTGIFMKTALFFGYLYIYEHARLWTIPTTLLNWVLLFLGVDFFYYWFHRLSHEVNAMWAAHIVHHQSEEYNLSVALRQSWFQSAFSWAFYLPLAWFGFDPIMFLTISSFNTLYQFWIHTRAIGRMGFLEWFMNTPSHHRVHHGSNPKYIDKNHAGTLIIWDRMFGTFQEEEDEPVYGITKPLKSWNPLWANFHYWGELFISAFRASKTSDKIKMFLKPPGWFPAELGGFQPPHEIDKAKYTVYDADSNKPAHGYIFFQFVISILITTVVLFKQKMFDSFQLVVISACVLLTIVNIGAMFENKPWVMKAEWGRCVLFLLTALLFRESGFFYPVLGGVIFYLLLSLSWLFFLERRLKQM